MDSQLPARLSKGSHYPTLLSRALDLLMTIGKFEDHLFIMYILDFIAVAYILGRFLPL